MEPLAAQESAQLIVRVLAQRPWVQPLVAIARPSDIVGFIRDQLRGVRRTSQGWQAAGETIGIVVSATPRHGALTRPAVISWGDVARHLRPHLTAAQLGANGPPDTEAQAELF